MPDRQALSRAFNLGCDARLQGLPVTANPFSSTSSLSNYKLWRNGFWDVHNNWGKWAKWPIMPLPEIRRMRETA